MLTNLLKLQIVIYVEFSRQTIVPLGGLADFFPPNSDNKKLFLRKTLYSVIHDKLVSYFFVTFWGQNIYQNM